MVKLYIPIFSLTLLLSASLLFSIQPMFSRMILPLLGGTPQVWNTAMLFFQICLLAGYGYAHGTTRYLSVHTQSIIHIILLTTVLIFLPFGIPEGWIPEGDKDPTLWQLSIMTTIIGAPFFALAASAPMLQRWFAQSTHPDAHNPYFLYGASNFGSLASLFAYPLILEPLLDLSRQSMLWMYGYIALVLLIVLCTLSIWKDIKKKDVIKNTSQEEAVATVTFKNRFLWIFLSFVPSSLMLGVTTLITTDIASAPLLWVLPLALYVGTFTIVFAKKPIINAKISRTFFDIFLISVIGLEIVTENSLLNPFFLVSVYMGLFFFASMVCHTELVRAKPHSSHLTEFYLIMSFGGALGGVFNAIIAPQLFIIPVEFALVLALCLIVRFMSDPHVEIKDVVLKISDKIKNNNKSQTSKFDSFLMLGAPIFALAAAHSIDFGIFLMMAITLILLLLMSTRKSFGLVALCALCAYPMGYTSEGIDKILYLGRNFFGVVKVVEMNSQRVLMHGTTNHGTQLTIEGEELRKISYYSEESPISDVIYYFDQKQGTQEFGALGLGIGVFACFVKEGRHFDFYEIDPEIVHVAEDENLFTFLSNCGSPYKIILGDARLKVRDKKDQAYDLIFADIFSSDNIPIHVLTKEAIELYLNKIKNDGALAFHISNRFLDLEPIINKSAQELGYELLGKAVPPGDVKGLDDVKYFGSHHIVITKNKEILNFLKDKGWTKHKEVGVTRAWTDKYSNIISAFGNKTLQKRVLEGKNYGRDEIDKTE